MCISCCSFANKRYIFVASIIFLDSGVFLELCFVQSPCLEHASKSASILRSE